MATTTSRIREVIGAYYTRVAARPLITSGGVKVFRYTPSPRAIEGADEWITLAVRVDGAQEFPAATKYLKYDAFTLRGEIWCSRNGAGDAVADAAQQRVEALLAEIETVLQSDPSLGLTDVEAELTDYEHTYSGNDQARWQKTDFATACRVRMVSS